MEVIGKRFPFGDGYIECIQENPNVLSTTWGKGSFTRVSHRVFVLVWNGYHHQFIFSSDFTSYYSICIYPEDYTYRHGTCGRPLAPPASPWVSCQLAGGIGNRLFQIVAALGLAERLKRRVVFYTPVNTGLTHQSVENIYSLFPHIPLVREGEDSIELYEPDGDGDGYQYNLSVPATDTNILMFGYRQNMAYFPSYSILPSFFMFPHLADISAKYSIRSQEEKCKTWFLHIRLGDFLLYDPLTHVTVDSYHIPLLKKVPADAHILLISNEPQKAKLLLEKCGRPFQVCEESDERMCLYIMSQCWGGAIVANSTFSWWGSYFAYMSTPYKWSYKAYYPDEWTRGKKGIGLSSPPWGFKSPVSSKQEMDIIGITICVNFDDILFHTIDQNAKFLKEWYIVTDPNDSATLELLAKKNLPNIRTLFYDKFTVNAKFNKGGAVRFAQTHVHGVHEGANVLLLDADVILPDSLLAKLPKTLEPDVLYGVRERIDYDTLDKFLTRTDGKVCWYGGAFVGFFQLYKGSNKYLYTDSESCCTCDNEFRDTFPHRVRIEESIAHLGLSQVNWEGRDYTKDAKK